ncbi:MAG: hypothetical protein M0P16_13340 [Syntrophales bacterium]|nr:hypothetical protein [Syntrophales bacterium]
MIPDRRTLSSALCAVKQMCRVVIIGEYIGVIHTQVLKRPLVIEKERIKFD